MNVSKMANMSKINRILFHHAAYEFREFSEVGKDDSITAKRGGSIAIFDTVDSWHMKRWATGCGYHFAIGNGRGIPDGEINVWRPLQYQGAHAGGQNHDSVGIMLMGNFTSKMPSKDQMLSCVRLVARLCQLYGLDPLGKYDKMRFAARNEGFVVSGHKDWRGHRTNKCPGKLHEMLPEVRAAAKNLMDLESFVLKV